MNINENFSDEAAILAQLASAAQSVGATLTSAVNAQKYRKIVFVLEIGSVGASGTVDFKVQWSATSGGTYADVANTTITQITVGSKVVTVEVRTETLMANNQGPFLKGLLTIGANTVQASVLAFGVTGRYKPGSDDNIAGVAQQLVA